MSSDLKDDLTDLRGVGDATAESILEVLDDHDSDQGSRYLQKAMAAAEDGDDRRAGVFLRRHARE
jgi:hypothetical protein